MQKIVNLTTGSRIRSQPIQIVQPGFAEDRKTKTQLPKIKLGICVGIVIKIDGPRELNNL
jgi:hypothetical protein